MIHVVVDGLSNSDSIHVRAHTPRVVYTQQSYAHEDTPTPGKVTIFLEADTGTEDDGALVVRLYAGRYIGAAQITGGGEFGVSFGGCVIGGVKVACPCWPSVPTPEEITSRAWENSARRILRSDFDVDLPLWVPLVRFTGPREQVPLPVIAAKLDEVARALARDEEHQRFSAALLATIEKKSLSVRRQPDDITHYAQLLEQASFSFANRGGYSTDTTRDGVEVDEWAMPGTIPAVPGIGLDCEDLAMRAFLFLRGVIGSGASERVYIAICDVDCGDSGIMHHAVAVVLPVEGADDPPVIIETTRLMPPVDGAAVCVGGKIAADHTSVYLYKNVALLIGNGSVFCVGPGGRADEHGGRS